MHNTRLKKRWISILIFLIGILLLALYPSPHQELINYVDRDSGLIKTEKVAGEKWLVWLYNNPVGEATLWALAKRKVVSSFYGKMMDRPGSAEKIQPFVEEYEIDLSIVQKQQFNSFNDFFTRKLKRSARPIDTTNSCVVSPADGKIMVWANVSKTDFIIKGYRFDVESFLNDASLYQKFCDGSLLVIRLAPYDYHRFHFPVSGMVSPVTRIDGDYYSVNPIALHKMAEIFCLNKREFVIISTPVFGDVIMAEVGATMVGSIVQTYKGNLAKKGKEKGYFEFGGSTVVLLFEKNKIHIDDDLLTNTANGLETAIKTGERIAMSSEF